jgi:hypothetical protein
MHTAPILCGRGARRTAAVQQHELVHTAQSPAGIDFRAMVQVGIEVA